MMRMTGNSFLLVFVLVGTPLLAVTGSAQDIRVVRRADRHALIILFVDRTVGGNPDSRDAGSEPVRTQGYRLVDLTSSVMLPVAPRSEVAKTDCPRPDEAPWPNDRICVALGGPGERLNDDDRYVLYIDRLPGWKGGKADTLRDVSVFVQPAAGAVVTPTAQIAHDVDVLYDIDLSGRADVALQLLVNGRGINDDGAGDAVRNARCMYRRGSLSFTCTLARSLLSGQSITAKLIRASDGSTLDIAGPIKKATYKGVEGKADLKTKDPVSDAQIYVKGGYTRTSAGETKSLEVLLQNYSLPGTVWASGRTSGDLSPYVDYLATTDPKTAGYFDVGLREEMFVSSLSAPFELIAILLTPQVESDKNVTVSNFIYLNPEVKIGLRGLFAGGLPGGGFYRAWPGLGIELGTTIKGDTVMRLEKRNPSRWKGIATLTLQWPASKTSRVPFAGFRIDGEARRYWLDRVQAGAASEHWYSSVAALYKLSEHTGVSYSWKEGDIPPLFKRQRITEVGLTLIY